MERNSKTVWMFTGQGALMPGAARTLYEGNAIFKNALDTYTAVLEKTLHVPILQALIDPKAVNLDLSKTQYAQPALVALQLAQIALWQARRIKPQVVVGHSIGEFAAAVAAHIMLPEDALQLSIERGRLMSECPPGGMAAVFTPAKSLQLPVGIVVAAENGPSMTVLAGPQEQLKQYITTLPKEIGHTFLPVSHAFHSPLMESAANKFRKFIESIKLTQPKEITFISTMTGSKETTLIENPDYWANQIVQPVRFLKAVQTICDHQTLAETIVEIGPASTLINMAKRIVDPSKFQWIASADSVKEPPKKSLFKNVPLPWNRSEIEQLPSEDSASCIYETTWVSSSAKKKGANLDSCLLLSRSTIDFAIPTNWKSVHVDSKDAVLQLLKQNWPMVVFIGSGSQLDIEIGLSVLQHAHTKKIVFSTEYSGLWGLARTFRLEHPDVHLRCIECEPNRLIEALTYEDEDEFSFGNDGVKVPRLRRCLDVGSSRLACNIDATYIVSGGSGALGLASAELLIERGAKHLLLLSRSPKLPAELKALNPSCQIECLPCDVSKLASLQEIGSWIQNHKWPKVRGIIHAAGLLADGTIENQTEDKIRTAFGAKVDGAQNLRSVFAPMDFLILFSSASAQFGSIGQASYAAANATLDALAKTWAKLGENVLSIQWGAWSEGGMARRLDAVKRSEAAGFGSLSNKLGKILLEKLIAAKKTGVVCVSPIDWSKVTIDAPLISNLRQGSLSPANKQSVESLSTIVREAVIEAIGRPIADNVSLLESGLDSLGSVSLRNRLATRLKITIPSGFLFESPDINSMIRYLSSVSPQAITPPPQASKSKLPILVIGAGIGGLSFARQLEKAGMPVVVMDKADAVGGVWRWLANSSSKLQIDSPAYDFDSNLLPTIGDHRWKTSFPQQSEILAGCKKVAEELTGHLLLNTRVLKVNKLNDSEYEVKYTNHIGEQTMRVSGVASMTGGLHHPHLHSFPDESHFKGLVGLGVSNDISLQAYRGASVVIVGHGAFAVENMRTALENGAEHVTILCRRRQMVFSTFCNWLLNSSKTVMPVADVVEVMRPFYKACGIEIEDLESLSKDSAGEWMLDQTTVPAGSDIYFLAQIMGKLTVHVGEVTGFTSDSVITNDHKQIKADIFLKCLGSDTDDSILLNIFGEKSKIEGLWINGDPNLITYNDGAQIPRKVKSLMCGSYAFFVQAFATAYLNYRQNREIFAAALARINTDSPTSTIAERVLIELWDFLEPAKRNLSERSLELCPFDRFQIEREAEWEAYKQKVADSPKAMELWQLLKPTLSILNRRTPAAPTESRLKHSKLGELSIFLPKRRRVLFLPGQGTNARLARALLERTGWIDRSNLDFVVPDAPYEMPAFTNEEQLKQIGLDTLVSIGLYNKEARYREWRAGFETLFEHHHFNKPMQFDTKDRMQWDETLSYVREVASQYGPFDGIAGFCEGASVASTALHLQARGEDLGLDSIRFFIAMSPWRSPMHEVDGLFNEEQPLSVPMLQIVGENDMPVFLAAAPRFLRDFAKGSEYRHNGQHVYPPLTPKLESKLHELLLTSEL